MKKLIILALFFTEIAAQNIHITNNYTERVDVIIKGSTLLGTGRLEKLISKTKNASIKPGTTRDLHVDVVSNISFTNLTDPTTNTAPYTLNFFYARYIGVYRKAQNADVYYTITPEGTVKASTKKPSTQKGQDTKS